jgi:hypothetical protein
VQKYIKPGDENKLKMSNVQKINATAAYLINSRDRGIPEIEDEQLKKLIPLLCQNLRSDGYEWLFNELIAITYEHFTLWLLKWANDTYHIEKDPQHIIKYIKECLATQNMGEGAEYDLIRVICDNNTELVISIEFQN